MNLKIVMFVVIAVSAVCGLFADDMRIDVPLEKATAESSGIYIAYPLTDKNEIRKDRTDGAGDFEYEYRRWIVTEVILDKIGVKKGDEVRIAEPYQRMEYDRTRLYREKGIDEGLIERFYTSESSVYTVKKDHPVIVFVIGNAPGHLVFTASGARESVKSAERIKAALQHKGAE